jgi:hypothetical protein
MTNINDIIIFIEEYIFDNTIEILFKKLNIEDKNLLKIYYLLIFKLWVSK